MPRLSEQGGKSLTDQYKGLLPRGLVSLFFSSLIPHVRVAGSAAGILTQNGEQAAMIDFASFLMRYIWSIRCGILRSRREQRCVDLGGSGCSRLVVI